MTSKFYEFNLSVSSPLHLVERLDLYTELPLSWQTGPDQRSENKNALSLAVCFPEMMLQRFCVIRVVEVSCLSLGEIQTRTWQEVS